ncbi:hypothetical protein QUB05_08250 [Microcoleus sp. F10-C6]
MDAQTWFDGRKDFVAALAPGKNPVYAVLVCKPCSHRATRH